MVSILLVSLTPVFFVLGLGFAAGRWNWVDSGATAMLGAFVAQFALPVSLFLAIVGAPGDLLRLELVPIGIYAAALLTAFAVAVVFSHRAGFTPITASLYALTVAMPNLGGIGLGLFQSLQGPGSEVSLAVANLVGTLTAMLACFVRLEMQRGGHLGRAVAAALLKPMTVLPTLGFAIAFAGLPFPALAVAALKPLALATGGTGLFLTGVILSRQVLRPTRATLLGVALGNLAQPAIALMLCLFVGLSGPLEVRVVVAMAIPSGFVGTILSAVYREGGAEAGGVLVATTFASVVTLPFWITVATLAAGA